MYHTICIMKSVSYTVRAESIIGFRKIGRQHCDLVIRKYSPIKLFYPLISCGGCEKMGDFKNILPGWHQSLRLSERQLKPINWLFWLIGILKRGEFERGLLSNLQRKTHSPFSVSWRCLDRQEIDYKQQSITTLRQRKSGSFLSEVGRIKP